MVHSGCLLVKGHISPKIKGNKQDNIICIKKMETIFGPLENYAKNKTCILYIYYIYIKCNYKQIFNEFFLNNQCCYC